MRILHLTLKGKWFDMIRSGEKKEEYREIKPYWETRLVERDGPLYRFKTYDAVSFRHGYASDAPTILVACLDIDRGLGREDWGAVPGEEYFVIRLGNIIN